MPETQGQTGQAQAAPVMPRVNLMPPEIAEAAKFRRFQLAMGAAVLAAVAVVGALYVNAHSGVKGAQSELDAAKAENTSLQGQLTSLAGVKCVYSQVSAKQTMLQTAMGGEVRWSFWLTDLSLKVPDNVWLTNLSAQQTATGLVTAGAPATATPTPVPGAASTIATISYSGTAFKHDDVATWLDALAKEHGFVDPYFTNSTEKLIGTKPTVNFTGTVGVTDAAKSNRYNKSAGS
jgi:Tfp pilus assembly protein PilN